MERFEPKTLRYLIAVVVICLLFLLLVGNAFKYLPDENSNINQISTVNEEYTETEEEQSNKISSDTNTEDENTSIDNQENSPTKHNNNEDATIKKSIPEPVKLEPLDEIRENSIFEKAAALRAEQKYESAVYEYEQIAKNSTDNEIIAKSYEEIAYTYASIKRYGTALSYAQKAFNTAPSTERELLLARIYYKTGNIDKATDRVNSILKRDFSQDK